MQHENRRYSISVRIAAGVLTLAAITAMTSAPALASRQKFRHVPGVAQSEPRGIDVRTSTGETPPDTLRMLDPDSLMSDPWIANHYAKHPPLVGGPLVLKGHQSLTRLQPRFSPGPLVPADTVNVNTLPPAIPQWLRVGMRAEELNNDLQYLFMITHPTDIDYAYWNLPVPPRLPEEDKSYAGYLKRMKLPKIEFSRATIPEVELEKRYWLHYFNVGLQFSQAYVSGNWYQGGTDYLAMLFNFTWNVDLNTVYHPNLLFQSALSYKLAINSAPKESMHKYYISQDNFQYNVKGGFKAFSHWFYSLTMQLRTPFFRAYPQDSEKRSASFMSPGTFTLGVGMTYTVVNAKKTLNFGMSISPLSYNLKSCIDAAIDHEQFNIKPGKRTASEIGSNLEANLRWKISDQVQWTSRVFLFTDYKYFLADWENTFDFAFNRFLSAQLYLHPRYDSSTDFTSTKWHYWQLKEILSIGLSYTFSTKQ